MNSNILDKIQELAKSKNLNSFNEVLNWLSTYTSLIFSQPVSEVTDSELIEAIDYAIKNSKKEFHNFSEFNLSLNDDGCNYQLQVCANNNSIGYNSNDKYPIYVGITENKDFENCFLMSIEQAKELSQFLNNIVDLVEGNKETENKEINEQAVDCKDLIANKLSELFKLNKSQSIYETFNGLCKYMLSTVFEKGISNIFGNDPISDECFYQMLCDYIKEREWE